jgi:hypothetical protein
MTIDLRTEEKMSLSQAARTLPPGRLGRPTSLSTLLRWIQDGVKTPSGEIVHLEALRLGSRWLTSAEALQRFAEKLTPGADAPSAAGTPRTAARRRRASEKAADELKRRGI